MVDIPVARVYIVIPPSIGKKIIASINLIIVVLMKDLQKFGNGIESRNNNNKGVG
jgi:hypothetical protein